MSGIAELLANLGYDVRGSDLKASAVTRRLEASVRVTVHDGHQAGNVGDADVVGGFGIDRTFAILGSAAHLKFARWDGDELGWLGSQTCTQANCEQRAWP